MNPDLRRDRINSPYDGVAESSAALVIHRYSNSFGLASRLLAQPVRSQVRNIYALVRVADEIVDNPDPGLSRASRERMLDWLEQDVNHSLEVGYSGNVVVHAFARTAVSVGIREDLVAPFFESMRMDLRLSEHTAASFGTYVYGSAEVVGLMCLRAFLAAPDGPSDPAAAAYDRLSNGARRLGAAFQKLNFLRDLAEDHDLLGRAYFPGLDVATFSEGDRDRLLDDLDGDLAVAAAAIDHLPPSSRRAVLAAHGTFTELSTRLRRTPPSEIRRSRVRVPGGVKLRIVAGALWMGHR